ncbi:MAG TPA: extracellular solute-binding protein [Bryobacteraceae bacterium]|nr:extracellular solute-binding protein [Bryobacteraceae bacterium]
MSTHKFGLLLLTLSLASAATAQTPNCATPSSQQLIIYRAGSLTRAFKPLVEKFTCETGIQVKDVAMGSVDAARQITAGGQACDLYAPADYLDIDLFMKPAGYTNFNIVFARGKMVLAYSASGVAAKNLPAIAEPGSQPFSPPKSVPNAVARWYETLTMPGVAIGAGNPYLDPGAYRAPMIFQLAEAFYKIPNLYNNLLEHVVTPGPNSAIDLGKGFDFQFAYEHNAQAAAKANPDYRYVNLPDEINLSDPAKDAYYRQHAIMVLPGLGTSRSAQTVAVPGARVAWGITLLKEAPHRENAVKFLQLLLGAAGTASLNDNGPAPISPALVSPGDFPKLPESLRPLVRTMGK